MKVPNHPGHLWRDKWTALSGPLSQVDEGADGHGGGGARESEARIAKVNVLTLSASPRRLK